MQIDADFTGMRERNASTGTWTIIPPRQFLPSLVVSAFIWVHLRFQVSTQPETDTAARAYSPMIFTSTRLRR
jgi:hypothetical protein